MLPIAWVPNTQLKSSAYPKRGSGHLSHKNEKVTISAWNCQQLAALHTGQQYVQQPWLLIQQQQVRYSVKMLEYRT